jgi:hypothetical protein
MRVDGDGAKSALSSRQSRYAVSSSCSGSAHAHRWRPRMASRRRPFRASFVDCGATSSGSVAAPRQAARRSPHKPVGAVNRRCRQIGCAQHSPNERDLSGSGCARFDRAARGTRTSVARGRRTFRLDRGARSDSADERRSTCPHPSHAAANSAGVECCDVRDGTETIVQDPTTTRCPRDAAVGSTRHMESRIGRGGLCRSASSDSRLPRAPR